MSALEKNPPKPASSMEFVTPTIKDDAGRTLIRSMRVTDKLQDLMDFYYAMVPAVPRGTGVFLYRRKRMDGEQRPVDYEMSNGGDPTIEFFSRMKRDMFVTLAVVDGENRKVACTVRKDDTMQVLMDFYYGTVPIVAPGSGRFLYEGEVIRGCQTPVGLGMEDDDAIHFHALPRADASIAIVRRRLVDYTNFQTRALSFDVPRSAASLARGESVASMTDY